MTTGFVERRAHVGVIVPAVNRTCEEQFHRHAPSALGVHTMRARIAGKWARPITELEPEIVMTSQMLAECQPDLMVYNCTASSMREGPEGEKRILGIMENATGIPSISTSAAVGDAFRTFGIKSVVIITPYNNNDEITFYLDKIGVKAVGNVALALPTARYGSITPQEWMELAIKHDDKSADAIFFSCAATTQIDAVAPTEAALNKPVINSNQSVLWAAIRNLKGKLGEIELPQTGSLMKTLA